jgi:hypothetical protein
MVEMFIEEEEEEDNLLIGRKTNSLSLSLFFFDVIALGQLFSTWTYIVETIELRHMLSYLTSSMQPQLSSESALAICSTSSDEDTNNGGLNSHAYYQKSPLSFVYGHSSTPAYGFGFNFYDEMSPFTGKCLLQNDEYRFMFII